jgi:hypothetical protein
MAEPAKIARHSKAAARRPASLLRLAFLVSAGEERLGFLFMAWVLLRSFLHGAEKDFLLPRTARVECSL